MNQFDPNARSSAGSGVFGLSCSDEDARVVLVPVPFEATTSYGGGAADGPRAILAASHQVDLFDVETGRPYEAGIAMLAEEAAVREWSEAGSTAAAEVRAGLDAGLDDAAVADARRTVDDACARTNDWLYRTVSRRLADGRLVGTIGGDHGSVFGAIHAAAEHHAGRGPLGILHLDAHADLRREYEGFRWSHASIMDNVLRELGGVTLTQVGIRDLCEEEYDRIRAETERVRAFFDADLTRQRFDGRTWSDQVEEIVAGLPRSVYVSFDVDGLDPALCPHTGTPVPGGLSFQQAIHLVAAVARSGRRIVGFDLNEVAPGPDGDEWNANVGARVLYKLIGWSLASITT